MNDLELMRMHAEALFTHDPAGRILRVNEAGGGRAPRFFLGRTAQGSLWRFRDDVDAELAHELEALCRSEPAGDELLLPPHGAAPFQALLARRAPVQQVTAGPAYHVPRPPAAPPGPVPITEANAALLRPHLEGWFGEVARYQPMLAVLADSRAVSLCASVRTTPDADEAGVETAPAFRGRGHAAPAVAAWAAAVHRAGRVPLYSTSWQNAASRALAGSLGLRRFGADLQIT